MLEHRGVTGQFSNAKTQLTAVDGRRSERCFGGQKFTVRCSLRVVSEPFPDLRHRTVRERQGLRHGQTVRGHHLTDQAVTSQIADVGCFLQP